MRNWQDLSPEEKYRIVEMAKDGTTPIVEICRIFGVTRTTLSKAMEKVEQAAVEALKPKPRGRKPKQKDPQLTELLKKNASLEAELKRMTAKYDFMVAYSELMPLTDPDEIDAKTEELIKTRPSQRKKKRRRKGHKKKRPSDERGQVVRLFDDGRGADDGNENGESETLGKANEDENGKE